MEKEKQKAAYDWASYYKQAYAEEKKQNNLIAAKIADAQAKTEDLTFRYNRICNNPFWKASAPIRKLWRVAKAVKSGRIMEKIADRHPEGDSCLIRYAQEVACQRNPYKEWIKENCNNDNNACYIKTDNMNRTNRAVYECKAMTWSFDIENTKWIMCGYGRGYVNTETLKKVKSQLNQTPSAVLAYADEDFYWQSYENRMQPWFKPDYSPDTLLSFNYFGSAVLVKRELLERNQVLLAWQEFVKMTEEREAAVSFYDLCLRLEEAAFGGAYDAMDRALTPVKEAKILHIKEVVFHREYKITQDIECDSENGIKYGIESDTETETGNETQGQTYALAQQKLSEDLEAGKYLIGASPEFREMKKNAFMRRGLNASLEPGNWPGIEHVVYRNGEPLVSVVIPSKDHPEILYTCLESFVRITKYSNVEFIVVDNGSNEDNRKKYEEEIQKCIGEKFSYTYIYEPMSFNFSKMCNIGARHARGQLILLLNDDMEIIEEGWLSRMVGQALLSHTGAVGAKLWYAGTNHIQHAGITNLQIGPSHKLITFEDNRNYYYGHNLVTYDMIGVTAACLLITKEKYLQVGGLDESMAVAYNDVDFCFKLAEKGYYNVLRNDAVLYHHESLSRGLDEADDGKWDRLLAEKERLYSLHPALKGKDPFYHEALIDNASDYVCGYKFDYEQHLHTVSLKKLPAGALKGAREGRLKLTVDRAQIQNKIHREEPEIVWIMGWCYLPGMDNAMFQRKVILQTTSGYGYEAVPANWYRKDVEAILPDEKNILLSGFVLRVLKKDLESGTYRIGMMMQDESEKVKHIAWSDKCTVINNR